MDINTTLIDRTKYPELNLLLWNNCTREISGAVAFEVYERNWAYVHVEKLLPQEKELITQLTKRYGKGIMLTS